MPANQTTGGALDKPITQLDGLRVGEISIVPSGANGKRFLLFKSADAPVEWSDAKKETMEAEELIKSISETTFDDEQAILGEVAKASPESSDEARDAAVLAAKVFKSLRDVLTDDAATVLLRGAGYTIAEKAAPPEVKEMTKEEQIAKALEKIEKGEGLEDLPPEIREPVEKIWKANEVLRERIEKMEEQELDKRFESVTKSLAALPIDNKDGKFQTVLKSLWKADTGLYDQVHAALVAADHAVKDSAVYTEKGTSRVGTQGAMSKIETVAKELMSKDVALTKEAAFDKAMQLRKDLYDEYREEMAQNISGRGR